jgi:hypothetical protein
MVKTLEKSFSVVKRLSLLIVLLGVLGATWVGYSTVVSSPEYAVVDLAQGLEAQNFDKVDKRVNMDTVIGHLADQVVTDELKRLDAQPDQGGLFGMMAKGMGANLVNVMKPAIVAAATQQIKQGIADVKLSPRVKDLGQKAAFLMVFRKAGDLTLSSVNTSGDTATMLLENQKQPTRLTLKKTGPAGWEVTEIDMPPAVIKYWMSEQSRTHQPKLTDTAPN